MAKKITLCLFCLLSYGLVQAQVTLLPKAGVSFTSYTSERFPEQRVEETYAPGLVAGIALNVPISPLPWLSVQPELNYLQRKHVSQTFATLPFPIETEVAFEKQKRLLSYLEVPVLLKATLQKGNWLGYLNTGPAVSYAFAGKSQSGNHKADYNFSQSNRLDVSVQAGLGLGYQLGYGTVLLDARYSHGFTYLLKEFDGLINIAPPGQEPIMANLHFAADQKSRVISFTLGYAFPLQALSAK